MVVEMSTLFIEPNINLQKGDERLNYFLNLSKQQLQIRWQSKHGIKILESWKEKNFDRAHLDSLVGKYYDHTDLRGIPLNNEDLEAADLSCVDFYCATLENVKLVKANLSESWLSEANIKGTRFDWATMEKVLIDNVQFNEQSSFRGVNLSAINFTLAALLQDLAIDQQRIANLESAHPKLAMFLRLSCDYGRSFLRFFAWAFTIIIGFSLLFYVLPDTVSNGEHLRWFDYLYFSFVTFTTLGYGDITPISWYGKLMVVIEVMIGYVMLGLLVAILSRRIIGR